MSDKKFVNRTAMRCTLHCVDWEMEGHPIEMALECPICLQEERNDLREKLAEVTSQRNTLVKAMKIVKTVEEK